MYLKIVLGLFLTERKQPMQEGKNKAGKKILATVLVPQPFNSPSL